MFVLLGCSEEPKPENGFEDFASNEESYYNNSINGVTNPYGVEKNIYLYSGYDKQGLENDHQAFNYCHFKVFKIKNYFDIGSQSLQDYLKKFDTRYLKENPNSLHGDYGGVVETTWIQQKEMDEKIFNPLNINLKDYYGQEINIPPGQARFEECIDFIHDDKEVKTYIRKYNHYFSESFSQGEEVKYNKGDFLQVIDNPDTLVKFKLACISTIVELYDPDKKFLIRLSFQTHDSYPEC